jgi:hypothetical protein
LRIERDENDVYFCEIELSNDAGFPDKVRVFLPNRVEVVMPVTSSVELNTAMHLGNLQTKEA